VSRLRYDGFSCEHLNHLILLYKTDYTQNQAMPKDRKWDTLRQSL